MQQYGPEIQLPFIDNQVQDIVFKLFEKIDLFTPIMQRQEIPEFLPAQFYMNRRNHDINGYPIKQPFRRSYSELPKWSIAVLEDLPLLVATRPMQVETHDNQETITTISPIRPPIPQSINADAEWSIPALKMQLIAERDPEFSNILMATFTPGVLKYDFKEPLPLSLIEKYTAKKGHLPSGPFFYPTFYGSEDIKRWKRPIINNYMALSGLCTELNTYFENGSQPPTGEV